MFLTGSLVMWRLLVHGPHLEKPKVGVKSVHLEVRNSGGLSSWLGLSLSDCVTVGCHSTSQCLCFLYSNMRLIRTPPMGLL